MIAIDGSQHPIVGVGNGAISSLANALHSLGIDLDVADYKEHAIGEGREVKAATYIECTASSSHEKVWGVGIHEDVVQASLIALLSAASSVCHFTSPFAALPMEHFQVLAVWRLTMSTVPHLPRLNARPLQTKTPAPILRSRARSSAAPRPQQRLRQSKQSLEIVRHGRRNIYDAVENEHGNTP